MRTIVTALMIVVLAGVALKLLVAVLEPAMAFYPSAGEDATPARWTVPFERVEIPTADGQRLAAWWLPASDAPVDVIYFHGNGGNLSLWSGVLVSIRSLGWSVMGFDYRGYGRSTGHPTEKGLYLDADAVLDDYWTHRHQQGRRVIYWGRSLGATVAAYAASRRSPTALILESPLYDARSLVASNPVLRFMSLFATYRFPTAEYARRFNGPALVIHGEHDRVVPFAHGKRVFESLSGPKQFLAIPGADHNDFFEPGPSVYWTGIRTFAKGLTAQ